MAHSLHSEQWNSYTVSSLWKTLFLMCSSQTHCTIEQYSGCWIGWLLLATGEGGKNPWQHEPELTVACSEAHKICLYKRLSLFQARLCLEITFSKTFQRVLMLRRFIRNTNFVSQTVYELHQGTTTGPLTTRYCRGAWSRAAITIYNVFKLRAVITLYG